MTPSEKSTILKLKAQLDELLNYLVTCGPLNRTKQEEVIRRIDELRTNFKTHRKTHHSIEEAYVFISDKIEDGPHEDRWHSKLYDAKISLDHWLFHYEENS